MKSFKNALKYIVVYVAVIALAGSYPLQVFAEEAAPTPTTTAEQPTAPKTTGTGGQSEKPPKPKNTYTYDSATNRWNTSEWVYDAASNTYKPVVMSSVPATTRAEPTQSTATSTQPPQAATATEPTNTDTNKSATTGSTTTNTSIANALDSLAKTGDASVLSNTTAGSAATGNAAATAKVINNVNSIVSNANNTEAATFVSDVMGDVNGDIMLQPMLLKAMLEASAAQSSQSTVNNNLNITNDLSLAAQSGNALVSKNTTAGNATSGSAHTVADVVNIMNSMIAANQSFMGTINIYGNLNGDILIAPDFIPQMLANNSSQKTKGTASTVLSSNDTQSIVNNVSLAAQTGQAVVTNNTTAGSATTGSADTNLVIFNLSGHEIVASNSLLVFVNVLGKWVGVIVDAPTGATAAAVGNNVTTAKQQSPSMIVDAANNAAITNNLTLASQSGNATVQSNTTAGNAATGNATSSANILNMTNSSIGLSGWFGVLFINVYGSWIGSFGVNTSAGTTPIVRTQPSTKPDVPVQVIRFVPRAHTTPAFATTIVAPTTNTAAGAQPKSGVSYAAYKETIKPHVLGATITPSLTSAKFDTRRVPMMVASFILVLGSAIALRKLLFS